MATARIVPPGLAYEEPAIGRVVSNPDFRRHGFGRTLMLEAIRETRRLYPGQGIRIGAQRYLEKFYGSLGFVPIGDKVDHETGTRDVLRERPAGS